MQFAQGDFYYYDGPQKHLHTQSLRASSLDESAAAQTKTVPVWSHNPYCSAGEAATRVVGYTTDMAFLPRPSYLYDDRFAASAEASTCSEPSRPASLTLTPTQPHAAGPFRTHLPAPIPPPAVGAFAMKRASESGEPCSVFVAPLPSVPFTSQLPEGTLHVARLGPCAANVGFVPYPTCEFYAPPPVMQKADMVRVFIGQLPYRVTDMQLNWLTNTLAGITVCFPERIMKRQDERTNRHHGAPMGSKLPTGCIHAYCDPRVAASLMALMHKRVLVDDTGVWYARTEAEEAALNVYCSELKADRRKRPFNRPYDTTVVQYASSTFVPPRAPPAYV